MSLNLNDINQSIKNSNSKKNYNWLQKDISFQRKRFTSQKKSAFFKQLSILLKAGVPLKESFQILIQEQSKKSDQQLLELISTDIIKGKTFAESLQDHHSFSEYDYFSIKIGEETGRIINVLQSLADFYEKEIQQRRNIISALTYPFIILSTSILSIFFMLKFVVPMFKDIFSRVGNDLPFLTEKIINLSNYIERYWLFFVFIILAAFFTHMIIRRKNYYQKTKDKILNKIPIINSFIIKIKLAQISQSLELLLNADIPLLNSLEMINNMVLYHPLNTSFRNIIFNVEHGKSLYEAIHDDPLFPNKFKSMVKVGEETHQLPYMFNTINTQYTEEIQHTSKQLGTILEPVIIIFLGVFVALILIAMYLPIFQISTSF